MKHEALTLPKAAQYRADTAGWDAVNCVRITEINDAIRNAGTSPASMEITLEGDRYVKGDFACWRVAPGGDGPLINLELPMRNVTIRRGATETTLEDITVEVQVRMELIPSGRKMSGPEPVEERLLVIAHRPSGLLMAADGTQQAATLISITGADDLTIKPKAALVGGVEAWLNENLGTFSHVFAAINISQQISEEAENGSFAWLKPTEVSYAFGSSRVDPDASVMAILCQTQGRSSEGLVHQADPGLIPPDCDAGVVVSRARFLRNMVGEALPHAFPGLKLSDIKYKPKNGGLQLAKKVKSAKVKHEGKTYEPVIHELDILLRDTEMDLRSLTKTEVSKGIFSVCSATSSYAFGLTKRKDGGKTLGFVETRKPKTVESTEKSKGIKILDGVLATIAAVGGLVLAGATAGALAVPSMVLVGILAGGAIASAGMGAIKIIEMVKKGDAPPIDLLMANATSAVRWSSGRTFDPTFAALNNGLQIGGTFVGADTGLMTASPTVGPVYQSAFQAEFADVMKERTKS